MRNAYFCFSALVAMLVSMPSQAQRVSTGRTVTSSVGEVGQRQTRDQLAVAGAVNARQNLRIATRIQSRLRSRIDRFYDPQSNAMSSIEDAASAAAKGVKSGRR